MTGRSDADIQADLTCWQERNPAAEPTLDQVMARSRLLKDVEPLLVRAQQAEAEVRLLSARAESMAHMTRDRNNWRDAALAAKQHYEQSDERIDRLRAELAEARAENERLRNMHRAALADGFWLTEQEKAAAERDALAEHLRDIAEHGLRADLMPTVQFGDESHVYRQLTGYLRRLDVSLRKRAEAALAAVSSEPVHNHGTEDGPGLACPERVIDGRLVGACLSEPKDGGQQCDCRGGPHGGYTCPECRGGRHA